MFHLRDNIFFGRCEDGAVRIIQFKSTPKAGPEPDQSYPADQVVFDLSVDADGWASIVSSVSAGGEIDNRFYTARAFHDSEGEINLLKKTPK